MTSEAFGGLIFCLAKPNNKKDKDMNDQSLIDYSPSNSDKTQEEPSTMFSFTCRFFLVKFQRSELHLKGTYCSHLQVYSYILRLK